MRRLLGSLAIDGASNVTGHAGRDEDALRYAWYELRAGQGAVIGALLRPYTQKCVWSLKSLGNMLHAHPLRRAISIPPAPDAGTGDRASVEEKELFDMIRRRSGCQGPAHMWGNAAEASHEEP